MYSAGFELNVSKGNESYENVAPLVSVIAWSEQKIFSASDSYLIKLLLFKIYSYENRER